MKCIDSEIKLTQTDEITRPILNACMPIFSLRGLSYRSQKTFENCSTEEKEKREAKCDSGRSLLPGRQTLSELGRCAEMRRWHAAEDPRESLLMQVWDASWWPWMRCKVTELQSWSSAAVWFFHPWKHWVFFVDLISLSENNQVTFLSKWIMYNI